MLGKRSIEQNEDEKDMSDKEFPQMSRQERKRHREKKRRGKVNAGFDDLKAALVQIDPDPSSLEGINRVDLITRTVAVLTELYEENKNLKLQQSQEQRNDLVTLAIPYLVPKEGKHQQDGK
mmetsp:Transcript_22711/g.34345  ORF Transcript_22711/g.34345 Transcript_22711/m.34345 type:complete len:121 (-) Transcript_22711:845-1207(-)